MLKRKPNQKGFTIIELLVVIVIIGILVALALPQLFAAQARGRDTDRKNDAKNIQTQLEAYFNDEGAYPVDDTNGGTGLDQLVTDGYMDAVPETPRDSDPTYDENYTSTDGTTFTLAVPLENDNDPDADGSGNYVVESVNQ